MPKSSMSNTTFFALVALILVVGLGAIGYVLVSRDDNGESTRPAATPTPQIPPSPGCNVVNKLLPTTYTTSTRDDISVNLPMTNGYLEFKAGEIIHIEGVSTAQSTSHIRHIQINQLMPDGTVNYRIAETLLMPYPRAYEDVRLLRTGYEIPADGLYNFEADIVFWEFTAFNEATYTKAFCEPALSPD